MQAAQAAQDLSEAQRTAYDYGRPSHPVQLAQTDRLPESQQQRENVDAQQQAGRTASQQPQYASMPGQSAQAWSSSQHVAYDYGSPFRFAQHPQAQYSEAHQQEHYLSSGAQSGRVRRHLAVDPRVGVPIGHRGQADFFDSMAAAMTGNLHTMAQTPEAWFYVPHMEVEPEPTMQGADATTINATTSTMTFAGNAESTTGDEGITEDRTISTGEASTMSETNSDSARPAEPVAASTSDATTALNQCTVCLEPFRAGEELRILPCLHRYHTCCIDEWLSRNPACPICKHRIQ